MSTRRMSKPRHHRPRAPSAIIEPPPVLAPQGVELSQLGAMGKAFSIIEIITRAREPLTMTAIVEASGLTKPTAHRITGMLAEMGFIERDLSRRGYVAGERLLNLSFNTLRTSATRSFRHAILRTVSEQTGETCNFGVLAGTEVIYLDRVEAKWPLGLRFEAGSRVPAHCTAIGKLLLAELPLRERNQALSAMPLTRYTARTITDRARLDRDLEGISRSHVGIDNQEFMDGVVCISVPVAGADGGTIGALAVSAPEARVTLEQILAFVPAMQAAAGQLAETYVTNK